MHDITVRRIVGLDLGVATAHTAQVLDESGRMVAKRRVVPTVDSFAELERAALAGVPEGVTLELVIEPTGPAWLPVAVWFAGRGHTVFRVSTQKAAVALYGTTDAVAFALIADEIATEIRLLCATEAERDRHEQAREHAYLAVDPDQLARTLPGIGAVGGPMLIAVMGDPDRFANGAAFKAYLGLNPKASETGETDRKGQPMSKAGNRDLRTQLIRSAETARRHDPQLAAVYYDQMVHKGAVHTKALCVVAARLAERAWTTLRRGTSYELRDIDGTPVEHATAKQLITDRYTVPEDVRRRRRSKKSGKEGPSQRSDAPEALDEATFPPDSVTARRPRRQDSTPRLDSRRDLGNQFSSRFPDRGVPRLSSCPPSPVRACVSGTSRSPT